ncbi:DNA glycosylase AlkZ-like family protein [Streptomyces sp. NPDC001404]|uniref:DNA glycosylase AlkZ-like family protein n=1 Tax=Streptomyces sp. NPDC001404 TaxID=3364571 RepID=UPI0036952535
MAASVTLPAQVERAAIAARHGWGPDTAPLPLAALASAQSGLHAARLLTPYVTAHTRNPAFTADELRAALAPGGTLVKIRCMRRTLHLWPLTQAPDAHTATLRLRLGATRATARRHGLTEAGLKRWGQRAADALAGGPLPYRDLQDHLAKQHPTHADTAAVRLGIKWAWESGHITCCNAAASLHREDRHYALLDHAHPGLTLTGPDARAATIALLRRYLHAYGPAAEGDLLWWTGLTRAEITPALAALHSELVPVRINGLPDELLAPEEALESIRSTSPLPRDHVRLLAFEDPTFKGYFTTRSRYHDPAHTARAFNTIGEVRAAITVAGRIAGTWEWDKRTRTVKSALFTSQSAPISRRIHQHLERAEMFLRTEPC